ncbi:hypothetical protein K1719_037888 [Acacia pycnantha]|nr:hypothetical protein K1719_037888 [Acacia pycnantha]
MDMDAITEQLVGPTKGRRTKRHRPFSSALTHSTSSSTSADDYTTSFNSSTAFDAAANDEEEDMANCLILLAHSGDASHKEPPATTKNISGFYVYECKTCNKSFPSFQALGGHRASHKKPKVEPPSQPLAAVAAAQVTGFEVEEAGEDQFKSTSQISLQLASNKAFHSNKAKIHECSICGSEFTSGQALGGHMRRHRASANTTAVEVKPKNVLELDLNLPAPEDDLRDSKFQFTPGPKSLMLSAPTLVDCHY